MATRSYEAQVRNLVSAVFGDVGEEARRRKRPVRAEPVGSHALPAHK